ncbi:radical SAM protein [soil metagenome]
MKILLTHAYFLCEDAREQEIMKPYPPLGILSISAYLEEKGMPNSVFDTTFSSFQLLEEEIRKNQPDVIGIYTNLMTKLNVLRVINLVKSLQPNQDTKVILGGPEVKNHAAKFLEHGADYIVFGEGEETMLALIECIRDGANLEHINGIAYTKNGGMLMNPERDKMKDLDELPFPNRKAINLRLYLDAWKERHGRNAISINTMRGCPYSCKWCSRAVYGMSYRRRSPGRVVEEMKSLIANYQPDTLWFVDDVFTISHKWLAEFAEKIEAANIQLPFECITRADRMNKDVIQLLKRAGCYRVWIGAESGSQKIIDAMDRRVDVNKVREMIIQSRLAGIEAGTFIMVGYPGETEEDLKETLHHLKSSNPDYYTITTAYPIKGTPLYEEMEPFFLEDLPWESSTDRMIDFTRTYPRSYYDYAIRWIYNEMALHKAFTGTSIKAKIKIPIFKSKALGARMMMQVQKRFTKSKDTQ